MNSCPNPATRWPGLPFPCWRGRERAQLERAQLELAQLELAAIQPATSRQPLVPRRMLLRRTVLPPLPAQRLPVVDEIRHDLRGCDDGETFVFSVQLLQMPGLAPIRAPARAPAPARVSTGDGTRLLEPRRELREARRARYRRTWAARARVLWLLPWRCRLRPSCGASSARSSICAYSCF